LEGGGREGGGGREREGQGEGRTIVQVLHPFGVDRFKEGEGGDEGRERRGKEGGREGNITNLFLLLLFILQRGILHPQPKKVSPILLLEVHELHVLPGKPKFGR
jgi:hypothetical protein